jgi:hypothetical protein
LDPEAFEGRPAFEVEGDVGAFGDTFFLVHGATIAGEDAIEHLATKGSRVFKDLNIEVHGVGGEIFYENPSGFFTDGGTETSHEGVRLAGPFADSETVDEEIGGVRAAGSGDSNGDRVFTEVPFMFLEPDAGHDEAQVITASKHDVISPWAYASPTPILIA